MASAETELALLKSSLEGVVAHQAIQDAALEALKKERIHALLWGIGVLGVGFCTLFGLLWNLLTTGRITH